MQTLIYATHDGVELAGDLYRPQGEGPHPVLIAVPGGGWRRGSRTALRHWGDYLAAKGVALFAIDHRRTVSGKIYPQNIQDVVSAVRFIGGEAQALSLDADRLGVLGSSAGAHLAAMAALAGHKSPFADGYPDDAHFPSLPAIKVLVGVYGVYELFSHWQADLARNAAPGDDSGERFLGATPYDDQQIFFDASPLKHLSYDTRGLKILLVWGDEDRDVLPIQSEQFLRAATQARYFTRSIVVKGAGHFWFGEEPIDETASFNAHLAPRLVRFLQQHLVGAGASGG